MGSVAVIGLSASASAMTVHVTDASSTGTGSLAKAIDDVNNSSDASSSILIDDLGPNAVIHLTQRPFFEHNVTIKGPGVNRLAIDFDEYGFTGSGNIVLRRMTLTGASGSPEVLSSTVFASALIVQGDNVSLDHVVVSRNRAHQRIQGDADNDIFYDDSMFSTRETLSLTHTKIVDNTLDVSVTSPTPHAYLLGGIVEGSRGLTIDHTEIGHNHVSLATAPGDSNVFADVRPGLLEPFGSSDISDSSISGNVMKTTSDGMAEVEGAIFFDNGESTITNSTIADNAEKTSGPKTSSSGAISAGAELSVNSSTISGNQGDSFANLGSGGDVHISNSIIADPKGGASCLGDFDSGGFNLDSDGSCSLREATDVRRVNPGLRALGDYGGSSETVALSPNSPAVDAGHADALVVDQRGHERTTDLSLGNASQSDGTDIGAFELGSVPDCAGRKPTIASHPGRATHGTDRADVILGTTGSDLISADGGRDVVCGRGGIDALTGSAGADVIHGGNGRDLIGGVAGDDLLFGGRGNDGLFGGSGQDRLLGGNGNDALDGGSSRDRCQGGKGRDKRLSCER